jgi:glutamate racemase
MRATALAPIGVFDSGVGGLSVLRHLRTALPAEDFLYVADSGHAPYGALSREFIRGRSLAIGEFLHERGAKALVVACNTATAAAVDALRNTLAIPVIAMEPGIKPAVAATRSKVIGVLATAGTLESARFFSLVNRYAGDCEIITQPCAGLVECVEANELNSPKTFALLKQYLEPLLAQGADTIVLGCTHYPFLRDALVELLGNDIAIIDTGPAVARELKRRLAEFDLLREAGAGVATFWSSGDERSYVVIRRLWHVDARVEALPAL